MKVILKQDVKGLGKKESMVEVSEGYARNFLIPKGLVVEATNVNINVMKTKKQAEDSKKERELSQAKELANKLSELKVIIKVKAGESGKLFGAISNKDIAETLKNSHKLNIDRKKILLNDPIKSIGSYTVEVKLYHEINAKITVVIEGV